MNKLVKVYDAPMFYLNTSLKGISFSYNGESILYSSDETGCFNVYHVFVSNNKKEQLTKNIMQSTIGISYFPSDNRFLFLQDYKGDELFHLWVYEEECSVIDLTPGINLKAEFLQWGDDGKCFWVTHNQRDKSSFDVYCYKSKDYQSQLVFKNQKNLTIGTISRDGRWLSCEKEHDSHSNSILLYNLTKEEEAEAKVLKEICVSERQGVARFTMLCFSPDSKKFFYTSNQDSEFKDVWSFDIETEKMEKIIQIGWDINALYFSPSGRYRVSEINQDSATVTYIHDIKIGKNILLPELNGSISQVCFSKDETQIAFYLENCVSPPKLYLVKLQDMSKLQSLALSTSDLPEDDLVSASMIRYSSFDGLEIPSLLYRPWEASSNNRVPAMVWVHGGPGDQSCKTFDPLIQYLVNNGYAILAVNYRGSRGYGKTFFHLADRKHGDVDLKDCIYGRKYLETLDWIDTSYIGIMGSSYGGYISVASLAFEPDVFDVGINIYGVTNWIRTLNSIPAWMSSTRNRIFSVIGDPITDFKRLRAISPYFHAANICKPLLVVQGKNDPRVLKVESDDIVEAVRNNGAEAEYLMFENEGHGFFQRENLVALANTCLKFLNRNLKKSLN